MLSKKQRDPNTRRIVQPAPRAKVFSYYQSRSLPTEPISKPVPSDGSTSLPKAHTLRRKLVYTPAVLAGIVLLGCLVYLSTIDMNPRLQVAGQQPGQGRTAIGSISDYQPAVKEVIGRSLFSRSKLFIDTNKLAQDITAEFPELGQVSITLPLVGRRPIVEVQPVRPVLVLASPEGAFAIDANGRALADIGDISPEARGNLVHIQDQSGLKGEKGEVILPEETVGFITEIVRQLGHKKINIKSIILPPVPAEMHLRLEGQPYFVKFNVRGQGRLQAGTLFAVKERLEGEGRVPSEYIDVRVPEKAFYK